ncbi:MAG: nucleoside-diphosphate sugar epimerase/dehydratase [bacterium]|nr:nucleoside-diphosphate sugar epimerase/dehydratase [bacterium]
MRALVQRAFPVLLLLLADLFWVNLGWAAGLWLRFEGAVPSIYRATWVDLLWPVNLVHGGAFVVAGYYWRIWKYADARDMLRLVSGEAVATAALWGIIYHLLRFSYPRSAILIAAMLTLLLTGGTRMLAKLAGSGEPWFRARNGSRVLVVGAGEAGRMVARELNRHPELGAVPVGFADDDRRKRGMLIGGLRVLADRANLEQVVTERRIGQIIIAMPSATPQVTSEWTRVAARTRARVRLLPGVYELLDGRIDLAALRDVRPEDFLGREPAVIDLEEAAGNLHDRVVLVTGAGGSIGSELCRQVSRFGPRLLVLLGNEENQLHELAADLDLEHPGQPRQIVLADIRDRERMDWVLSSYGPAVVFHAAAHKHVPLLENNPEEAVKNNLFGTRNVALAALAAGVRGFVYVSSDKAVRPSSVMGATKRVGELIVQSLNREGGTVFVAVRFGNVLGSRGSVLPLFQRQVARGGPVTVTDPEATRYFMTVEEACQLLLQAAAIGHGGQVLILDMGTPVRILELAENVIRLAGKEPGADIPIQFIGLRPGEKVHEELLTAWEEVGATSHDRIFVAQQEAPPWSALDRELGRLEALVRAGDGPAIRETLFRLAAGKEGVS